MAPGDANAAHNRILAGLQRLATFQHPDGMYSIWCGGEPGVDITARVAHRLLGLRGLPYPAAEKMLDKAAATLREKRYVDNALLPLGPEFGGPMEAPEDAVAYYFAGNGRRDEALDLLRRTVVREGGAARWRARCAWGGDLEVTADAARVMYAARDELFLPAFAYVGSRLVNGMLYSTADTRALVELLASLAFGRASRALVDGVEVALADVALGKQVTALSADLLVRVDREVEVNHLEPRADFQFAVDAGKQQLQVGERTRIVVRPGERTIAPLVRLFLPGNLALLVGGANAQTAYLPVEREELVVDAVAVRPGRGNLYVMMHDMYDASKVGVAHPIEITVRA